LRAIKDRTPDLVVLDVSMPEIDGFEVCRRIRRDGLQVPVIFLTARDDIDDLRTGFRQGGDDYLTKPFSLEELGLRIEALLRRARGTGDTAKLAVGDVVLDERAHQVLRDDREVTLSPTEFRLLRFLMLNRGRVMSKAQIVDHVWEYDFDGNYGIVETYVAHAAHRLDERSVGIIEFAPQVGDGALLAIPTTGLAQESTTSTTAVEEETPDTTTDTTVAEEPGAPSEDRPQGGHRNGECEERANEDDTSADT
jgi:two-component system OmpR family response regulator